MIPAKVCYAILLTWNLVLFGVMGLDKRNSRRNAARIPERFFLLSALFMGATGVWVGMYSFRHKTSKWKFYLLIPLLFVINAVLFYLW